MVNCISKLISQLNLTAPLVQCQRLGPTILDSWSSLLEDPVNGLRKLESDTVIDMFSFTDYLLIITFIVQVIILIFNVLQYKLEIKD